MLPADAVGQQVGGAQVFVVERAGGGDHFAEGVVAVAVEDEMRPGEQVLHGPGIVRRGAAQRADDAGGEPQGEVGQRAHVQQRKLDGLEALAGALHEEEALLHQGPAAGPGRFVDGDVLPLPEKVGKGTELRLPADELLAGDGLVVLESAVHTTKIVTYLL